MAIKGTSWCLISTIWTRYRTQGTGDRRLCLRCFTVLSGLQLHQMALWVRCGAKEAAASRRAQVHANDRFRLLRALELEQLGRAHGPVAVATAARAVDEVGLGLRRRPAALGSVVLVVLCLLGWPPRRATPKPITPAHYSAQASRTCGRLAHAGMGLSVRVRAPRADRAVPQRRAPVRSSQWPARTLDRPQWCRRYSMPCSALPAL